MLKLLFQPLKNLYLLFMIKVIRNSGMLMPVSDLIIYEKIKIPWHKCLSEKKVV